MDIVLFLSGFMAPSIASKSRLFFDEKSWKNCKTIFYQSKMPTSPVAVERELVKLNDIIGSSPTVHVIGHSLGAWWAANLACRPQSKIKKMVLWTPLGIAGVFPIFNVAPWQEPFNGTPNPHNIGPDKTLVVYAKQDLIVPYIAHALPLVDKFRAKSFALNGGHVWQSDHVEGLQLTKRWLELD